MIAFVALLFLTVSPVAAQSYGCYNSGPSTDPYQDPSGSVQRYPYTPGTVVNITDANGVSHQCQFQPNSMWACQ